MLAFATPEMVHYRLKELDTEAARVHPERPPTRPPRPTPPRVAVVKKRRPPLSDVAVEPAPL